MSIFELTAKEIYDTYIGATDPGEVVQESRNDLATRLRVEENLSQEEAYHAADEILAYAWDLVEAHQSE
ncbi:MAG: hypothetical protein ACP5JJ_16160 [Anaerolineae bacterium]